MRRSNMRVKTLEKDNIKLLYRIDSERPNRVIYEEMVTVEFDCIPTQEMIDITANDISEMIIKRRESLEKKDNVLQ